MNNCLCCNNSLLRHIRHSNIYWYCSTCRQDMPQTTATAVTRSFAMVQRQLTRSENPAFYVPVQTLLPVAT
ncbi:hypothetical protein [Leptothoe sp. PORK10 BA2]|uniref:hypothetical protein n=1 Tax=Leptothoe sp. PORK10 BA2 TaxID=3110254 RepID=UPI002B21E016|nr:hypothetical protein [Leptothoe sp. PORK10 BA2]MEA5464779.1 hypothetical protein [Leptothoe sp. PORK10 BA2]